ncbi:MAG: restriction endonuclease subunit S [candidate division WOR-3 bacterium]
MKGNGFKETEIGLIPEDWEVVRIVDHCDFIRGTEPGSKSYNRVGNGVPFIRVGNISAKIQELVYTTSSNIRLCNEDDILISLDGSPGVVVRGIKGAYASGIRKVVIKTNQVEKGFIYYILQSPYVQRTIQKYTTGVTIKHASKSLPHIKIPLPPLSEQQKIAKVLDKIQQAIELQDRIIELLKNLKKSLMQKLFTEGLYGEEQKETEIGLIPKSWEVVRLGEIVEIFDKYRIPLSEEIRKKQKKIYPYCGANGIIDYVENYIFEGEYLLFAEDGGHWGKFENSAYIMTGRFWVNNHAHVLKAKNTTTNYFLVNILNYLDLTSYITGDARGKINQGVLKTIKIPLPPLEEQKQIAHILSTVDKKIEVEQRRKEVLKDLFKTMLHKLMSGEIRLKEVEI